MSEMIEHWIEIDDTHVKHVMETVYTKEELTTKMSFFLRPAPATLGSNRQPSLQTDSDIGEKDMLERSKKSVTKILIHEEWADSMKASGRVMTTYACPICGYEISALVPPANETYDSLTCCPSCHGLHFKTVNPDSSVSIKESK